MNVPVILQRGVPGSVVLCSTVDSYSASAWETFGRISGFLREWVTRLLRSILVLLFSVSEVAALVVDTGSGLFSTGFAGEKCTSRCVPDVCLHAEWRSVHSICFGRFFFLGNLDIISSNPLSFAVFSAVRSLR